MIIKGKVYKMGDNIDTDLIIPARHLTTADPLLLAPHCMEDFDGDFHKKIAAGDIICAGKNFGCGSSREHAPLAIKGSGIACVVAASFARIFYRNAINIGLYIAECPKAGEISANDELQIDFAQGKITNLTQNKVYNITPLPPFIQKIAAGGGILAYTKAKIGGKK